MSAPKENNRSTGSYCKIPGKARYKLLLSWTKRHCVLWGVTLRAETEAVAGYNKEHQEPITYYQMRDAIANERNIVTQALTPDDDC